MKSFPFLITLFFLSIVCFTACQNEPAPVRIPAKISRKDTAKKKPETVADTATSAIRYHFISLRSKSKPLRDSANAYIKSLTPEQRSIIFKLNRVDAASYRRLDTMVIPDVIDTNWMAYCIFPQELPVLKDVKKMIIFAYYPEAFGAYENGHLIKWGPTNMGKKASPTPTGLFFTNWKAKETISTVNDEWKLKWNFNISNAGGVGFHQYQLPGYPASHSCLRLLEADAMYFYTWADQWILKSPGNLLAQGTPVLVYGAYPFGQPKPWWSLVRNGAALNIPADTLNALLQPNVERILAKQSQRDSVIARMPQKAEATADTAAAKI